MKINKNNSTQQLTDTQRQLVVDHIPFANHMGIKFAGLGRLKGITVEELQSDACLGLCEAALRYNASPLQSPASFQTFAFDWCRKFIMLHIDNEDFTSDKDINDMEDDITMDDDTEEDLKENVELMMSVLNEKEREVVSLIFGFNGTPKDFREIASLMGVKSSRVHQIYENAMAKMEFNCL